MSLIRELLNFKFKFKFKFRLLLTLILILTLISSVFGDNSSPNYVQSFERVAVFHNHATYGHLGVTIDFDGYLHHFHVL